MRAVICLASKELPTDYVPKWGFEIDILPEVGSKFLLKVLRDNVTVKLQSIAWHYDCCYGEAAIHLNCEVLDD